MLKESANLYSATVITTRYRSKFTLKFSEFSYKIKTRFVFVLIANYNCISLDRIIIKAWLDIMRFVVVI